MVVYCITNTNILLSLHIVPEENSPDHQVGSGGTQEENSGLATTAELVVVDQTASLLCVDSALLRPSWTSNTIIRDTLLQFAEHGDVQTAISMYMVLRLRNNYRNIIDEQTLEYWFNAYIELLHRLQLFNNAR